MPQKSNNNFASKDGNPKAASTRIGSCTAKKLAGQIRHDLRRGPQPEYVDADRAHLNRILIEPLPPGQMRSICEDRRALRDTQRAMKSNSAVGTRGVITFGAEAAQLFEQLSPDQQDAAFQEVAQAVADRLATSVHGLVVHLDEATIHAHYQLAAYNVHGEPISKTTRPKVLSELQDITAEIMARHCPGIERGTRYGDRIAAGADFADTLHKSVRELHRTLPADLDAKRAKLADLAQAETEAAARVDEMRGRVEKLAEKADLTEKEVKRLATYEKRLSDRLDELKAAQAASEAAKIEADRLAALTIEQSRVSAGRIKHDAEARAVGMTEAGRHAAETLKAEAKAEIQVVVDELDQRQDQLDFRAADLDRREDLLKENAGLLRWGVDVLQRLTGYMGEKLGLRLPAKVTDALDKLDAVSRDLPSPAEEPAPDRDRPGF